MPCVTSPNCSQSQTTLPPTNAIRSVDFTTKANLLLSISPILKPSSDATIGQHPSEESRQLTLAALIGPPVFLIVLGLALLFCIVLGICLLVCYAQTRVRCVHQLLATCLSPGKRAVQVDVPLLTSVCTEAQRPVPDRPSPAPLNESDARQSRRDLPAEVTYDYVETSSETLPSDTNSRPEAPELSQVPSLSLISQNDSAIDAGPRSYQTDDSTPPIPLNILVRPYEQLLNIA